MASVDSLPAEQKIAFRRKTIHVMADLVNLATLMIRAQDYPRGRDNFFIPARKIWFMFGGTIKRFDADLGSEIESLFNRINTALDQAAPSQDQLVTDLSKLDEHITTAVQISDERI